MKRKLAECVAYCLTCKKSKVEKKKLTRMFKSLDVQEWKWDNISMDFRLTD